MRQPYPHYGSSLISLSTGAEYIAKIFDLPPVLENLEKSETGLLWTYNHSRARHKNNPGLKLNQTPIEFEQEENGEEPVLSADFEYEDLTINYRNKGLEIRAENGELEGIILHDSAPLQIVPETVGFNPDYVTSDLFTLKSKFIPLSMMYSQDPIQLLTLGLRYIDQTSIFFTEKRKRKLFSAFYE